MLSSVSVVTAPGTVAITTIPPSDIAPVDLFAFALTKWRRSNAP